MTVEIQGSRRGFVVAVIVTAMFVAAGFWAMRRTMPGLSVERGGLLPGGAAQPLVWKPLGEPGSGGAMTAFAFHPRKPERLFVAGDMLGIGVSGDDGKTYGGGIGLPSFEIGDFSFDPAQADTVWVGTMSGPAVSYDNGETWAIRRNGFPPTGTAMYSAPVEKVLFVDPAKNPNHLLAFGGSSRRWQSPGEPAWGAIWESGNSGESWTRLVTLGANGATTGKGINIVSASQSADGAVLYAGLDGAGVWRSGDRGKTWAKVAAGLPHDNIERVVADPRNPRTVYAVFGNAKPVASGAPWIPGGVFKSVNTGTTWRGINNGLDLHTDTNPNFTARFKAFCVSPANPDILFVADSAWNKNAVYRSGNGGESWQLSTNGANVQKAYPAGVGGSVLAAHPTDPDTAILVGSESILRTNDGGKTWTDAGSTPGKIPGSWRGRGYSGLVSIGFRFHPNKPGQAVLLGMDAGKLWQSDDGLQSWTFHGDTRNGAGPWGGGDDATFAGDCIYVTAGQFGEFMGILRSQDGGKTWDTLSGESHGLPAMHKNPAQAAGIYAPTDAPGTVFAVIGGVLYHSKDFGDHWRIAANAPAKLSWLAGDPANPSWFYASGEDGVFSSTDGGKSFAPVGTNGPHPSRRLHVDTKGRLYATSWRTDAANAGLWRWGGRAWTRLQSDPFIMGIVSDPRNPSRLLYCTTDDPYHDDSGSTGVYASQDDGKTWTSANAGLPIDRGVALAWEPFPPYRIVFGTTGRGYFVTQWPDTTGRK